VLFVAGRAVVFFAAVLAPVPLFFAAVLLAAGRAVVFFAADLVAVPLFFAPVLLVAVLIAVLLVAVRAAVLFAAGRMLAPLLLAAVLVEVLEAGLFAADPLFIDAGEPMAVRDAIPVLADPAAAPFLAARAAALTMLRPGVLALIMLVLTAVDLAVLAWLAIAGGAPALLCEAAAALPSAVLLFDARLATVLVPVAARCDFIAAGLTAACVCLAVAMPDRVLPWFAPMSSEDPWGSTRLT
jgi:hypothetical protein